MLEWNVGAGYGRARIAACDYLLAGGLWSLIMTKESSRRAGLAQRLKADTTDNETVIGRCCDIAVGN